MSDARQAGPDGWGLEPKQSREEGGEGVGGAGRQGGGRTGGRAGRRAGECEMEEGREGGREGGREKRVGGAGRGIAHER